MAKRQVGIDPSAISEKWNRNMKNSVSDIQAGIDRVTDNPAEKAIAKQDKMLNNLTQSVQNGKWAAGLRDVNLGEWKSRTREKVAQRLSGGVDGAMSKRRKFDQYLVNTLNGVLPSVADMPDMTIEDSVNRVRAVITHMANNPYKGSGA